MKLIEVRQKLEKQGLRVFTSQEFRRAAGLSPASAKFLLIRYVKQGYVHQLKKGRGLYGLADRPPHPFLLANRLYRPSYISLESALSHYGLLPESVYAVTSVSTRGTRTFQSLGRQFTYQKLKAAAFTGYLPLAIDSETVWIASPEKAAADMLYFAFLTHRKPNERIRWSNLRKRKVLEYVGRFGRSGLEAWVQHVIG